MCEKKGGNCIFVRELYCFKVGNLSFTKVTILPISVLTTCIYIGFTCNIKLNKMLCGIPGSQRG